ncbi:hypothetical protein Tco_0228152 [Tanacetum coccineum]
MGGYKSHRKSSFSFFGIFMIKKSQRGGGGDTWEESMKAYKVHPSDQDKAGRWADLHIDSKATIFIINATNHCDLPSCDDFSPINVYKEKSMTFSNPLFDSNNDFTSCDDKSLSDEDVPEDNVKIYLNPLFEFNDEYISGNVNPLFDEVLEDIESGDVDEIELLLHRDPSTPKISVASILEGFTDEPPLEENDDLFDLESKENEWKKILYDASIDDLMTEDKVFDPKIHEKNLFSNISELIL